MKNAEITPAVEAKTKGTNQVAVGRRLGTALRLSKEFCGPGFGKGSLLRRLVRQNPFTLEHSRAPSFQSSHLESSQCHYLSHSPSAPYNDSMGCPKVPVMMIRPLVPSKSLTGLIVILRGLPSHMPSVVSEFNRNFSRASLAFEMSSRRNTSLYAK
jgi:hypothetical protein